MACREQGMDCDFEITDEHEEEMVDFIQIHARSQHDVNRLGVKPRGLSVDSRSNCVMQ
ncbi:DUF1059 domain-containing protein [Halorussus ruber]|uniref:DUF1059 domain-containing protein n=1 Tax=Halorussus ruber TaxID=1126238 RepID=UPI00248313C8|nr:DUF1059 domain-containing protein [Halorussus ruber]